MNFIHSIITIFLSLYNIGTHFFLCIAASELRASVLFSKSVRFLSCGIWYPLHVNHFCRDLSRAKENDPPCCRGSFFCAFPRGTHMRSMCSPPPQATAVLARSCGLQGWVRMCRRHMYAPRGATSTDAKHPEMRPQLVRRTEKQKTEVARRMRSIRRCALYSIIQSPFLYVIINLNSASSRKKLLQSL